MTRISTAAGSVSGAGRVGSDEQLRRIEAVTDAALSHLDVEDLLVELLDRVRDLLDVDTAAVLLLDRHGDQLVATAARGLEDEVRQGVRLPIGEGFAGRIARDKRPLSTEHIDHADVLNPILAQKQIQSLLGVPMLVGGEIIGVMHVGTLTTRKFSDEDVRLLEIAADRASIATQSRLRGIDRAAALALQRSLLPARLPEVAGVELAARYVAGRDIGVGGDWYDVFLLPTGWLGVVIGDVTGHGLRAAVVMGRLRSALRAYALECDDPAEVLSRLDRKAQHFEAGMMATAVYAMIPPDCDRAHVSLAGHPQPVLATAGLDVTMLDMPVDRPLGTGDGQIRRAGMVMLPADCVLVLYTDGLVERRGESIDDGLRRLTNSITVGPADRVCATIMANLVGSADPADDIALLALRRRGVLAGAPPGHPYRVKR